MLLNKRYFTSDNPGGGGQPETPAGGSTPAFDKSKLPAFLQKYEGNTLEEVHANASKGYFELVNMTKEVLGKVKPLTEKAEAYDRMVAAGSGNTPQKRSATEELAEALGVDPALVARAAAEAAGGVFSSTLAPVLGEYTAMQELEAEPGFAQVKPHVQKWLNDPANALARAEHDALRQSGAVKQAWELATFKWHSANPNPINVGKAAAGMIPGSQSTSARPEVSKSDPEKLKAAKEYFDTYGDSRPLTHERFKGTSIEKQISSMEDYVNGVGL